MKTTAGELELSLAHRIDSVMVFDSDHTTYTIISKISQSMQ